MQKPEWVDTPQWREKRYDIIQRHMEVICPEKVFPDGLDKTDSRIQALLSELSAAGYEDERADWLTPAVRSG